MSDKVKLENENGEELNLTLSELRDVARGKAVMMMREVQSLNDTKFITKAEIPDKFVQCFQCLAEVLILEERIFGELVKLVGAGEKTGLFDQFKEFSNALTPQSEQSKQVPETDKVDAEPNQFVETDPALSESLESVNTPEKPLKNETQSVIIGNETVGIPVELTSEVTEN